MSGGVQVLATLALSGVYTGSEAIGSLSDSFQEQVQVSLSTGSGINAADTIWKSTRTLAASASENLDLNGVLADVFGSTVNLLRVKAIMIAAHATNTNGVVVGDASSNAWATLLNGAGTVTLPPGAAFAAATPDATGWVVTPATGDQLKVANAGGSTSVTYDVLIIGAAE